MYFISAPTCGRVVGKGEGSGIREGRNMTSVQMSRSIHEQVKPQKYLCTRLSMHVVSYLYIYTHSHTHS